MSVKPKSPATSAKTKTAAQRRQVEKRLCIAAGKRELSKIQSQLARYQRMHEALANDIETLRFQQGIVRVALQILAKL